MFCISKMKKKRNIERGEIKPQPGPESATNYTMISAMKSNTQINKQHKIRGVSFFDFKGLMAPVFTCFLEDEEYTLDVSKIDTYASYLKSENIKGVMVNGVTGEGPAMSLEERKQNAEAWWKAAITHNLIMMLQVGGASLPNVLELAKHAEELGVHAVLCLPELLYKPRNVKELVGYLKIIAKKCISRPFFYYHVPKFTEVDLDMMELCRMAEEEIPNFLGLQYSCTDLMMGSNCLRPGRVILLGVGSLLASGMILGFDCALVGSLNLRPDLSFDTYEAMMSKNLDVAQTKQRELNALLRNHATCPFEEGWVASLKTWFNQERRGGFTCGPQRKHY